MEQIIKKFCDEYGFEYIENLKVEVVDNISLYIQNDDYKYYSDRKKQIDSALGILYEDSKGQLTILVQKQDLVNLVSTLVHEYVHVCDYRRLSREYNNTNFRELQEDDVFIYWTEFHATYVSYIYLIDMALNQIESNINEYQEEIKEDLRAFYSSAMKLERKETVDKSVRSYGSYIALYERFPSKVTLYPDKFFLNKGFLDIYSFLLTHKTFEDFIKMYSNFKSKLYKI